MSDLVAAFGETYEAMSPNDCFVANGFPYSASDPSEAEAAASAAVRERQRTRGLKYEIQRMKKKGEAFLGGILRVTEEEKLAIESLEPALKLPSPWACRKAECERLDSNFLFKYLEQEKVLVWIATRADGTEHVAQYENVRPDALRQVASSALTQAYRFILEQQEFVNESRSDPR